MGMARVVFSPEHNSAAICYDRTELRDLPTDAINHAYEVLYDAPGNLGPYIYEAWSSDEVFLGLVISERLTEATGKELEARITLEFERIVRCDREASEMEPFDPKEMPV
jgi:hypothetical protein